MTVTEVLSVWFVSRDLLGYSGKPGQLREAIVLVLWGNLNSLEQLSISRMLASAGTRHNVPESLLPQVGVHTFLIVTEPHDALGSEVTSSGRHCYFWPPLTLLADVPPICGRSSHSLPRAVQEVCR